ncbi:uncharacterized protein [Zea mays]|jgi:hypothetical protein|nr:uncharacterized protein LOC118476454 [Zea mays]
MAVARSLGLQAPAAPLVPAMALLQARFFSLRRILSHGELPALFPVRPSLCPLLRFHRTAPLCSVAASSRAQLCSSLPCRGAPVRALFLLAERFSALRAVLPALPVRLPKSGAQLCSRVSPPRVLLALCLFPWRPVFCARFSAPDSLYSDCGIPARSSLMPSPSPSPWPRAAAVLCAHAVLLCRCPILPARAVVEAFGCARPADLPVSRPDFAQRPVELLCRAPWSLRARFFPVRVLLDFASRAQRSVVPARAAAKLPVQFAFVALSCARNCSQSISSL